MAEVAIEEQTENVTILENYVTTKYVAKLLSRTELTIHHWTKKEGLPYIRIPGDGRDTIRYDKQAVIQWATQTGRRVKLMGGEDECHTQK